MSHPRRSFGIKCCLPLLVLDFALDIVNGVRALHLEGDGLARECLYEDLHGGSKRDLSGESSGCGGCGGCGGVPTGGECLSVPDAALISRLLTQRASRLWNLLRRSRRQGLSLIYSAQIVRRATRDLGRGLSELERVCASALFVLFFHWHRSHFSRCSRRSRWLFILYTA